MHRFPTMHHYDQSALAADEIYEELEESVDCKGFVEVADGVGVQGRFYRNETDPGGDGVDGDHEEDADYVALEEGFAVVFAILNVSCVGVYCMGGDLRLEPYRPK